MQRAKVDKTRVWMKAGRVRGVYGLLIEMKIAENGHGYISAVSSKKRKSDMGALGCLFSDRLTSYWESGTQHF